MIPYLFLPALGILLTLLYATHLDLKERRVPKPTWYPMLAIGTLPALWFYLHNPMPILITITIGATAYLMARINIIGGADAYAILYISFLLPTFPLDPLFGYPALPSFPLAWLLNTAFLSIMLLPCILLVQHLTRKTSWLQTGVPWMLFGTLGYILTLTCGKVTYI